MNEGVEFAEKCFGWMLLIILKSWESKTLVYNLVKEQVLSNHSKLKFSVTLFEFITLCNVYNKVQILL